MKVRVAKLLYFLYDEDPLGVEIVLELAGGAFQMTRIHHHCKLNLPIQSIGTFSLVGTVLSEGREQRG